MRMLFPSDPLAPRRPDPDYEPEAQAAARAGADVCVVHLEPLIDDGDVARALRFLSPGGPLLYRGWMLRVEDYEQLAAAGVPLLVDPKAYRTGHWLPGWYPLLEGHTPRSVWSQGAPSEFQALLDPFGDRPVVVKDYVKSRKHEWAEACFVPRASDRAIATRVIRRFLELQGTDLAGGLVVREFLSLESAGLDQRSGMPRVREYRLFLVDGLCLTGFGYWDGREALPEDLPISWFEALAHRIPSRFLCMDVARRVEGGWIVVEVGDGQVSGLPDGADPERFYSVLVERLSQEWSAP